MLHVEVPNVPVPAELETAVKSAREALEKAGLGERGAAQQNYDAACAAVREHIEKVGVRKFAIPREVEDQGADAVEAFIRAGGQSATPEASARKRRA